MLSTPDILKINNPRWDLRSLYLIQFDVQKSHIYPQLGFFVKGETPYINYLQSLLDFLKHFNK